MAEVSRDEVKAFLKARIAELMNVDLDSINDDAEFIEEIGITSIMLVDILVSSGDEFGVNLEDGFDLKEPLTVNILADKIINLMQK